MDSFFVVELMLPRFLEDMRREAWWEHCIAYAAKVEGFLGAEEGSKILEKRQLDSGAPIYDQSFLEDAEILQSKIYFQTHKAAECFAKKIKEKGNVDLFIREEKIKDWNESWKKSFQGVEIDPFWEILPDWKAAEVPLTSKKRIVLNPSTGFGSGTHPTTQMCLEVLGKRSSVNGLDVLDFGTGSGILAVAAAKLGAQVDAIEIDPLALNAAKDCALLNGQNENIRWSEFLESISFKKYDFIFANILRHVLLEFCEKLIDRMKPRSQILLTGLLEDQADEVEKYYREFFEKKGVENLQISVLEKQEWRLINIVISNT